MTFRDRMHSIIELAVRCEASNHETPSEELLMLAAFTGKKLRAKCGSCGAKVRLFWTSGLVEDRKNFVAFAQQRCKCGAVVKSFCGRGSLLAEALAAEESGDFSDGKNASDPPAVRWSA